LYESEIINISEIPELVKKKKAMRSQAKLEWVQLYEAIKKANSVHSS